MPRLSWSKIDDDKFELLCAEFLRRNSGEIEEARSGDGVDFCVKMPVGDPALDHTELWGIRCRGWSGRSVNDRRLILETNDAINAGRCDAYVVMTKNKLTQGAKAWIEAHNNGRRPLKIFYFDGELLSNLLVATSDFPLSDFFGDEPEQERPAPETLRAYVDAAKLLWPDESRADVVARELQENLASFRNRYAKKFGPVFDVAYATQRHEIHYLDNGWISLIYRITLINLGQKRLRTDNLTIRPRERIDSGDMQLIITQQSSGEPLAHTLLVDGPNLKVVEVTIPHGLDPRASFSYDAAFRLRCQNLEKDQFFEMPTWALTRDVSFMVFIPGPSQVTEARLLGVHQDASDDYIEMDQREHANGHLLTGGVEFPNIHEVPRISFYVEPPPR